MQSAVRLLAANSFDAFKLVPDQVARVNVRSPCWADVDVRRRRHDCSFGTAHLVFSDGITVLRF
jgi:hypothetical protein